MKVAVHRREHFNAAHRLFNPEWDNLKNDEVFGKCNNPNFHGHNYELDIRLIGPVNPATGYVIDLKLLSTITKEFVLKKFDHKNLNLDVPEFTKLNPTAENIAIVIWNILREKIDKKLELKITLYETERNYVEYPVD